MEAGDFYASSGVRLKDVRFDAKARKLDVVVEPDSGASYRIDFIATLKNETSASALPTPEQTGIVVATVEGTEASYTLTGKELYVRALITSSLEPADPVWAKQKQQAWTQPVGFK